MILGLISTYPLNTPEPTPLSRVYNSASDRYVRFIMSFEVSG